MNNEVKSTKIYLNTTTAGSRDRIELDFYGLAGNQLYMEGRSTGTGYNTGTPYLIKAELIEKETGNVIPLKGGEPLGIINKDRIRPRVNQVYGAIIFDYQEKSVNQKRDLNLTYAQGIS